MNMSAIPVIDVAPLMTGSPEQAKAVAAALGQACREVGFFYITGHGIPPELRFERRPPSPGPAATVATLSWAAKRSIRINPPT
jgi:hypothetical protein